MSFNLTVDAKVRRGPESWAFIYIALGFALTIESTVIAMIEPVHWPWNVLGYLHAIDGRYPVSDTPIVVDAPREYAFHDGESCRSDRNFKARAP